MKSFYKAGLVLLCLLLLCEMFALLNPIPASLKSISLQEEETHESLKESVKAKVAIVIDDFGQCNNEGVEEMMSIDRPLTFAIMPNLEFTYANALRSTKEGFEVIVHVPMEPNTGKSSWLGPGAITSAMTENEIKEQIRKDFIAVPNAVGFNNHMGSKVTSQEGLTRPVLEIAKEMGFIVLDSKTTENSVLMNLAEKMQIPCAKNDVFLDSIKNIEHMKKQLQLLASKALAQGSAVGIGHVGQNGSKMAKALKEMIPLMESSGIKFVFLSEVAKPVQKPLASKIIAIDPGHGGYDPGATWEEIKEKDINLAISKLLKEHLEAQGAKVILTRTADYNHAIKGLRGKEAKRYDLNQRIKLIHDEKADILLTVHVNSTKRTTNEGAETFFHPKSQAGLALAYAIQEELRNVPGMKKRIPKHSNCYMIVNTKIPTVLVEIGYLSNAKERKKLHDPQYLDALAAKIASGTANYFLGSSGNAGENMQTVY